MDNAGTIRSVSPEFAIPGGEITIECDGFRLDPDGDHGAFVSGMRCTLVSASPKRILAIVPDCSPGEAYVHLESGGTESPTADISIGEKIADEMHIVANPAIDPSDDAIIVTRSGSRGQQLPSTIFRIEKDGYVEALPDAILNPTGIAFNSEGTMFVTNRAQGEVYVVSPSGINPVFANGLGIATGVCFDADDVMYVGDRSGTIYRVPSFGTTEEFTTLEPSVAAYHLAFGPDGRLFVSAPGLASHDAIYAIDKTGNVEKFAVGFGRPQGLAFDREGYLYVAACYAARRGIFRVAPDGLSVQRVVAGMNLVGLCFTREGRMIVASNDSVYSLKTDIPGTLLQTEN